MNKKYQIQDFLNIKHAWDGSFSPKGDKIAFLSNKSGVSQLYLITVDGKNLEQLTSYDDFLEFSSFSPVKDEIIFGMGKGGNEKTQFFLFDLSSRSVYPITDKPNVIYHWGDWSRDGKFITYASNERNGIDFDVYVMDLKTKQASCVFNQGGWCDSLGFSPSGSKVMIRKAHTFLEHDLYLVDLKNTQAQLLTPHSDKAEYGFSHWLPDESGFFYKSNEGRDLVGLAYYDVTKSKSEYILTTQNEIEEPSLPFNGKSIAVPTNKDGYVELIVYSTNDFKIISNHFPKGIITGMRWSNNGEHLIFSLQSATENSDVWVWSKREDRYWQITHSPNDIEKEIFVEPKLISYLSFDKLEIPAFIYLPQNNKSKDKCPAIIMIHGGPEGQFRPGFDSLVQFFVYRGYAVVAPNVRGSTGYGKKYTTLDDRKKRMDSVKDLEYLHKFLQSIDEVDSNRIALMGGSYGGYMVLAGLTFQPDLWAAGIDIVGFSNLVTFLKNTSSWRRALREAEYGYLKKDKTFLESISPLNFIENIKAPLFIVHGANDPRVPLSEAQQIFRRLKKLGGEVELLIYSDEGHGLAKLKNRLDAYPKIVDFLNNHL